MVYSTSKCPSCGRIIRTQTNPVKVIDIPFERCRYCGSIYLNSYKEEWITKSPFRRFFFFLPQGVWARAIGIPMLILLIPLAAFDLNEDILLVLWPILSLAWLICGYFLHKKVAQDAIAESLERTKDPKYLNLLKQAGYNIYLTDDTPFITSPSLQTTSRSHESVATSNEIHFCGNCGQKLVSGSLYCDQCGERIGRP